MTRWKQVTSTHNAGAKAIARTVAIEEQDDLEESIDDMDGGDWQKLAGRGKRQDVEINFSIDSHKKHTHSADNGE
jgi:ABC-type cobalamin transport system ATPase subunit